MIIETWILVLIVLGVFLFGLIGIVGWILEGERLSKQIEENTKLQHENKELRAKLIHRYALDNIKEANDYYNKEN